MAMDGIVSACHYWGLLQKRYSTNYEIDNHGFITKKLFKDFSFEDIFLRKTLKLKINETKKFIKNKIILITGGAGSIGGFLAKNLIQYKPKKVFNIDNNGNDIDSRLC